MCSREFLGENKDVVMVRGDRFRWVRAEEVESKRVNDEDHSSFVGRGDSAASILAGSGIREG